MRYLLLFLLFAATPALACPVLKEASPAENAIVTPEGPREVTLRFSGGILVGKSALTVTDARGRVVGAGKPYKPEGANDRTIALRLRPLPPGTYKVAWDVLCDCDAFTPGGYVFTVRAAPLPK